MSANRELAGEVQTSWQVFLEAYEPLRPDLYRYCRHLTASPWDAEDLTQDTLARAFVTLAQLGQSPANPRAWLFRVASNLWIDWTRRRRREPPLGLESREPGADSDPRNAREAAGTLLGQLAPKERAAVVLKDVFGCSLEEVAETLATTVGAVKAALHRARGKLIEPPHAAPSAPPPAVLDAFCAAFNAGDLERLTALLLDTAQVEVVGATVRYGQQEARRTVLRGMLFGVERMVSLAAEAPDSRYAGVVQTPPRIQAYAHRGGWVLLHWYAHREGERVRAVSRIEADGDGIAHLWNYFYSPELIAEVCAELGFASCTNGYRWWSVSG
jgi:RNA polymerase sigma-70 factor (ECF subfamily)